MGLIFFISISIILNQTEYKQPPELHKRQLIIYANPTTLSGKLVKQHLERDWIKFITPKLQKLRYKDRISLFREILKQENRRRIIHKYFDVKIVETSNNLSFKVGRYGKRIYFPEVTNAPHPNEFPGYITFFLWVVDTHYHGYFLDYHAQICNNIKADWRIKRDSKKNAFVAKIEKTRGWNYIGYGYYGNDEFWTGGFLRMDKDGIEEHISLTKAGWIEPPDPDLPDKPKLYPCPVNKKWQLPY